MSFNAKLRVLIVLTCIAAMSIPGTAVSGHVGFKDFRQALGPPFQPQPPLPPILQRWKEPEGPDPVGRLLYWNEVMLNTNAVDHIPAELSGQGIFGEQLGPHRTSRAFAIVQIAVYDSLNAIKPEYESYTGIERAPEGASPDAAIAQASHDTLVALYPSQAPAINGILTRDLQRIPNGPAKTAGIRIGSRAAQAILALRSNDGSDYEEPVVGEDFFPSPLPGKWRPDPVSMSPLALGAYWGHVKPFIHGSLSAYDISPPPSLRSREYAEAFNEVKKLGGDGVTTPTIRTREQTIIGIYWGYDGTPGLGAPPRMMNQIVVQIAARQGLDYMELSRLLALVNAGMADTAIACWKTKYFYQFWRPVTGVREADPGTGPTGFGDGNPWTKGDPNWTPLGAPASNLSGPNFTPPFPSYASGHASFGGLVFETLRLFFRTDKIAFTFISDEYNGLTRDNTGKVRPVIPRRYEALSAAEEELELSRIYLGIHWRFDQVKGDIHGRDMAGYIFSKAFLPVQTHTRQKKSIKFYKNSD